MLKEANITFSEIKRKVFIYGVLNFTIYVILFLLLEWFGLLYFSGLRMLNYVSLFLISLYQINRWIKETGGYIPSLQALASIFLTGTWSFMLLGGFIFSYSFFDHDTAELYFNTYGKLNLMSAVLIFFEGSAGSMIVALVAMMYADRYQDGEVSV